MIGGGSLDQGIKTGLHCFAAAGLSSGAMGSDPLGATTGESTFNIANTFGAPCENRLVETAGGVDVTGGSGISDLKLSPELQASAAQSLQPAATTTGAAAKPPLVELRYLVWTQLPWVCLG
jgi:hypothetical protein